MEKLPERIFENISRKSLELKRKYFHQPVRQMQHIRWKDWLEYGKRKLEKCRENKKMGRERRAYPLFFYEHLTDSYQEDDSLKKEK